MKNQKVKNETIKKERLDISITPDLKAKLLALKAEKKDTNWDSIVSYMFDIQNLRIEPKGAVLAEITLKKWLAFGFDKPITVTELRKWTGVRSESCQNVFNAYSVEIEVFNNNLPTKKP